METININDTGNVFVGKLNSNFANAGSGDIDQLTKTYPPADINTAQTPYMDGFFALRIRTSDNTWRRIGGSMYGQISFIGNFAGRQIKVTAPVGQSSYYAFLYDGEGIAELATPHFCVGESGVITVEAGASVIDDVPSDCKFLYVMCAAEGGTPNYPQVEFIVSADAYLDDKIDAEINDSFGEFDEEVDWSEYELISNVIQQSNVWSTSTTTNANHYLIPLDGVSKITAIGGDDSVIAFLNGTEIYGVPSYALDHFARISVGSTGTTYNITRDMKYLYVRAFDDNGGDHRPAKLVLTKKAAASGGGSADGKSELQKWIDEALFNEYRYYYGTPLVLLQATDLHGSLTAARKYVEVYNELQDIIDVPIHTGDSVEGAFASDFTFWATAGMDFVLNMIGNHDSRAGSSWSGAPKADVYDRYIAPYVDDWNVVQPTGVDDSSSNYYKVCYYYKDFSEQKIRLIVFDSMYHDTYEDTWFENVLTDARTNGLAVAVCSHYQVGAIVSEWQKTAFASYTYKNEEPESSLSLNDVPAQLIDAFVEAGGIFLCWISGHRHIDDMGWLDEHPNIFNIILEKSSSNRGATIESDYRTHDGSRSYGTESAYSFNLIFLFAYANKDGETPIPFPKVKVIRLGNTKDQNLRRKERVAIDVAPETKAIIGPIG